MRAGTARTFASRLDRVLRRALRHGAAAVALALGLLSAAAVQGQAPPRRDDSPRSFMSQRGARISLQQATAMALSRYQGRVVRAEPKSQGDRVVYEIRILGDDGRVRTVRIDAETGQFL